MSEKESSQLTDNISLDSIMAKLNIIDEAIKKIETKRIEDRYESEKTDQLNTALATAMKSYKPIECNRENPHYADPYADLNMIMSVMRPILSDNDLSVTQRTILKQDGSTILQTRLWHSSGQWIETRARIIPSKNDLQTYGSNLQYNKRYQLTSLLGITITYDFLDDEGEMDMVTTKQKLPDGRSYSIKRQSFDPISKQQIKELEKELYGFEETAEQIKEHFRINTLANLPQSKYEAAINHIRYVKDKLRK